MIGLIFRSVGAEQAIITNEVIRCIGEKAHDQKIGPGKIKKWLEIRNRKDLEALRTDIKLEIAEILHKIEGIEAYLRKQGSD